MSATAEEGKPLGKKAMQEIGWQDDIKKWGWRIENKDNTLTAIEINGDRRVGPAASLKALHTQVSLVSGPVQAKENGKGNGKTHKLPNDGFTSGPQNSERRLPTMEEPEIDELNALADRCVDAKDKKEKANAAFKDECDIMREKMREYGRKRYTRRGMTLTIEDSEKLVIKKAEAAPPKNPRTKKGGLSLV